MSAPLWSGDKLTAALGARAEGAVPPAVTGASIDTRTLEPGDVFFAIKGEARDGHDFVNGALEKGAALAVIDESHAAEFKGAGALAVVPDVLKAMEQAGSARRAELKAGVVWANTFNKFDPASPFGGYKESGFGREGGRQGLLDYVTLS